MAFLRHESPGRAPTLADQIRSGDPWELSHGEAIHCAPTGGRGAGPNALGASVVGSDPAVKEVGVDVGYSPAPNMLRAPDVAVGNVPDRPGWVPGAPDLAIEYADVGQDEAQLERKIKDLMEAGTKVLWVVRLAGPRRVEVHRAGRRMSLAQPGDMLSAPGILKNDVPVEALYDRSAAERVTLTNLLQRRGYDDLEDVLRKGFEEGRDAGRLEQARHALRRVLEVRGFGVSIDTDGRLEACTSVGQLEAWLDRAVTAASFDDVFPDQ